MNFTPLSDNVLIKPLKEQQTDSGIFLPEKDTPPEKGEAIAVGKESTVKQGDTVIFSKFGVSKITIDNQEYFIVSEKDILGIIN